MYTHKPVSPPVGSGAPCCGNGLSGNCLLIIDLGVVKNRNSISIFNNPQIQNFPSFSKFQTSPLLPPPPPAKFYKLNTFEKSSKKS